MIQNAWFLFCPWDYFPEVKGLELLRRYSFTFDGVTAFEDERGEILIGEGLYFLWVQFVLKYHLQENFLVFVIPRWVSE